MSTGLGGLDYILQGVLPGDNIVWQVDTIDDYIPFVRPFYKRALREGRKLVYFRFAEHRALVPQSEKADIHRLHPEEGFETFLSEIFSVIEECGPGACYVFDCLSELATDWFSDRMLGNFFMLTCPYLYDFNTVTYFAILRINHINVAIDAIHSTAQVVLDVYRKHDNIYLHPKKVYNRYSPTLYMLHSWEGNDFLPVTRSTTISEITTSLSQPWLDFSSHQSDVWSRTFMQAQLCLEQLQQGENVQEMETTLFNRLLPMAVTRDKKLLELARQYFTLSDLVAIGKRMVGTGLIGGKSTGMLLARAILKKSNQRWQTLLEPHDSFFIGSDVFYTYLIQNGCWWLRRKLKTSETFLKGSKKVRQRMLSGSFPAEIKTQFMEILEYFGQSAIIVRSSSLLEDGYGNAFSGKYDSVFCANQGTPQERLEVFMDAVCTVYASTMKNEALEYRKHLGLLDSDEQMALLVQRVSGAHYSELFFPQVAGVGLSFNPYVWNSEIDPEAGMLRLVFGLGTRAVDRSDDDYTRVVALNAPNKRPETNIDKVRKYAQKRVDVLDMQANKFTSCEFEKIAKLSPDLLLDLFVSRDVEMEKRAKAHNASNIFTEVLTFDRFLSETAFVDDMRDLLQSIQKAYKYPVDVEFTANFVSDHEYRINLVQCRPFQAKGKVRIVEAPENIKKENTIFSTSGPIIGNSISLKIDLFVYVVPSTYSRLSMGDRYAVARLIGKLTHLKSLTKKKKNIFLLGPGRWGTSTPSLGVPVTFSEINTVSAICEIAAMHEGLIPDVSLGTHFFNDLVDVDMLYLAIYPDRKDDFVDTDFLSVRNNELLTLLPDMEQFADVVKVFDMAKARKKGSICLNANTMTQKGLCYWD
ncbi:MAG: pyruvate, phosphate dikinase [Fibrobacteria bacterium]|nr:pyruvate, phosphate dikinase [Fibrobacteria bacterium]